MSECLLFHQHLERSAKRADHIAIVDEERQISYADFLRRVNALAERLLDRGARRGDRVAILLPKCVEECVALYAVSRADCVFVPINPALRPAQVRYIIEDCGASLLVSQSAIMDDRQEALGDISCLKATILVDHDMPDMKGLPAARALGEDLAAILYTSGSTGHPKGVMLSHRNLLAGTRIVRSYLKINKEDRLLSILPFSFDYGLNQLQTVIEQGATIVLLTFKLGDQIVRALEKHKITGLAGVPTIWAILTKASPLLKKVSLPHLRYLTNSGGRFPEVAIKRLRDLLPNAQIYSMYGLTEAFRSTYLDPLEIDRRPTSIGKAIPECEVFPITRDGRRAAPGEPGILVHRGPTVSLGYWNRPDETAKVLRPNPLRETSKGGDIVCYSGDLVTEDEDGFLYFVGRSDDMIKSSGHRISPTEVEEVLMESGALRQVAVIGLPDEWVGQKVYAVAVAADDAEIDHRGIMQKAAGKLPDYMMPARLELVSRLPTTPNGKVDYKRLVAERST